MAFSARGSAASAAQRTRSTTMCRVAVLLACALALVACGGGAAKIRAFSAVPHEAPELEAVFHTAVADDILRDFQSTARSLPKSTKLVGDGNEFLDAVRAGDQPMISLIAHNDNGLLRFGNGSSISLAELGIEAARHPNQMVVVVGCETTIASSRIVGYSSTVTFATAERIRNEFATWFDGVRRSRGTNPSLREAQIEIDLIGTGIEIEHLTDPHYPGSVRLVVTSTGLAVTGGGFFISVKEIVN